MVMHMVPRVLVALRQVGVPSFLTALKRFCPSNPVPLSFPIPGWIWLLMFSLLCQVLVFDRQDREVVAAGWRSGTG